MKKLLVKTHCKRCGCDLYMREASLFGANAIKAELGQVCGNCLTPEEDMRIQGELMKCALQFLTRPEMKLSSRRH